MRQRPGTAVSSQRQQTASASATALPLKRDTSRHGSEGGASPSLRHERLGHLALTGACRDHRPYRSTSGTLRGVPSLTLFLRPLPVRTASRTMSRGATLAVQRPGEAVPTTRQAAGVPSARSQLLNHLSRDRADGATLAHRARRPAARDTMERGPSHPPARPTVSRTRDTSRCETDGQAGRPPPQCGPEGRDAWASRFR